MCLVACACLQVLGNCLLFCALLCGCVCAPLRVIAHVLFLIVGVFAQLCCRPDLYVRERVSLYTRLLGCVFVGICVMLCA